MIIISQLVGVILIILIKNFLIESVLIMENSKIYLIKQTNITSGSPEVRQVNIGAFKQKEKAFKVAKKQAQVIYDNCKTSAKEVNCGKLTLNHEFIGYYVAATYEKNGFFEKVRYQTQVKEMKVN